MGGFSTHLFLACCCSILLTTTTAALAASSYELIALEGTSAGPGAGIFRSFGSYSINNQGRVVFNGHTDTLGYFEAVARPEPAHLISQYGLQAPDLPTGVTFALQWDPELSSDGQIAFAADLHGPGYESGATEGVWAVAPGSLRAVAQVGQIAPGTGGQTFDHFDTDVRVADGGHVAFFGYLEDYTSGLWAGTRDNLQLVALEGGPTPGLPGGTFDWFLNFTLYVNLNRHGQIAFYNSPNDAPSCIWSGTPGNLTVVAKEGLVVPGFGQGTKIESIGNKPQINDDGIIAFNATVEADLFEPSSALYLKTANGIEPAYEQFDLPPGFPQGSTYGHLWDYYLGRDRNIVFNSWVTLPDTETAEGLFAHEEGDNRLVARIGDALPGSVGGLHFSKFQRYYIAENGQVAFMSEFAGSVTGRGIWIENGIGELVEVVRTGQQVELAPGDIRTITALEWHEPVTTVDLPCNELGQIVFEAAFGSTSALFLYSPAGVPGDYNGNGVVDAADYTVWRDRLGSNANLPNDETPGSVTSGDYTVWKTHFGQSAGSGSISLFDSDAAVPEPTSAWAVLTCIAGIALRYRGRYSRTATQSAGM